MIDIWCGRAHRLWAPMVRRIEERYRQGARVLVLVPEQYTLQAERDLMRDMEVRGFFRLDVLSPTRLQFRVLDALGRDARVAVDERGKAITVARALQKIRGQLSYYQGAHERPGLVRQLSALLSTLRGLGLRPEQIAELAEGRGQSGFAQKLRDTAALMSAYESLLAGQYADQQDVHRDMLRRLAEGRPYAGAQVFVYGFDTLTEPLHQTLLTLGAQAEGLLLTMVADRAQAPDGEAFGAVRRSLSRFMEALSAQGLQHRFRWLEPSPLAAPPEIVHLEREMLGIGQPVFPGPAPAIRIYAAPTPHQEAQRLAEEALGHLRAGVQAEDIMVVCGSLPQYGSLVASAFADHGIACYVADRSPLSAHGIVRCLLAALRCAADGWRPQDVEDLIKSGFTDLTDREGWQLANYARRHGIRGKRWTSAFQRGEAAERVRMDGLREKLTAPVAALHRRLVEAQSAAQSLEAARLFLSDCRIEEKADLLSRALTRAGLLKEAMQLSQVLGKLGEIFDQLVTLMAEERVPLRHFAPWLEAALGEADVGSLPPERHMVQVGQLGNLLPHRPKVVFLLGLNDGALGAGDDLLLSREETEAVEAALHVSLGLSPQAREEMAQLDLWKAAAAPSRALYLSYALANEEGGALRPLAQLTLIQRMFASVVEEGGALSGEVFAQPLPPPAAAPALDAIASRWREGALSGPWLDAWAWLCRDERWRDQARQLSAALAAETPAERIAPDTARAIYPEGSSSVSRLETFALCPYQHFVQYGLRPREEPEAEVGAVERGNLYHEAMDRFVRLAGSHPTWPQVGREESDRLMEESLRPLLAVWEELPYLDTARQRRAALSYRQLLRRMAWTLTQGAQQSGFIPGDSELRFGRGAPLPALRLPLPGGGQTELHGTIDRVDRYLGPLGAFLRVVDYKSSRGGFDPARVWEGAQLQLLLYLRAALLADPGARPAGAFYQWLADPIISTEDEDKVEGRILGELRLRGIALNDRQVIEEMDRAGISLGKLLRKDGQPVKDRALVDRQGFSLLEGHSLRRAAQLARRTLDGDTARSPLFDASRRGPCEYCRYGAICRIDPLDAAGRRRMDRMSLQELLDRVRAEGNGR